MHAMGFRSRPTTLVLPLAVFVLVGASGSQALAHKLVVFAYADGPVIKGEAYFHGGGAAQNADVVVKDNQGNVLAQAKTDHAGQFSFTPPEKPQELLVVVTTGEGHAAEFKLSEQEVEAALRQAAEQTDNSSNAPATEAASSDKTATFQQVRPHVSQEMPTVDKQQTESRSEAPAESAAVGADSLARLVSEISSVNDQIKLLRRDLLKYQQQVRLHDILGGIGYIVGLTGLAMYFSARAKANQAPKSEG